jgi:N-acetylmuramoyl-L-alanine amidase
MATANNYKRNYCRNSRRFDWVNVRGIKEWGLMAYSMITVNAGHSVKAPGASGHGYREHEVARIFKDKLITALKSVCQPVCDTTSDAGDKNAVLAEQVRKCNAVNKSGRLDVSIHLNAGGGTGSEVLYYSEHDLAAKVSAAICDVTGFRNRGAKERKELYFLRNTNAPAILIELCFIDNAEDMKVLMAKMDDIVAAVVKALTGKEKAKRVDAALPQKSAEQIAYEAELAQAVEWAKDAGVSNGERLHEAPTRAQLLLMLYRFAKGEKGNE